MDTKIMNTRFYNQISWPTVFVAAGFAIGLPYLARRYGWFSNASLSSIRPQELVNKATDAARSVADKVGMNVSGSASKEDTTENAPLAH